MSRKTRSYSENPYWKQQMALLPPHFQMAESAEPKEETWNWRGNRVHLDRYDTPNARAKVILQHGVGTNGRQMTLLLGQHLPALGFAAVAPDSLGYGMSEVTQPEVLFDDWVELLADLVRREARRDPEIPVFLFGLSAGGMISFHAAGKAGKLVHGIIGLTFLDERLAQVRKETVIHPLISPFVPLVNRLGETPLIRKLKVPMKWVSKMHTLSNDRHILKAFLSDPTSSASKVSLSFLSSFMQYVPPVEPENFDICPIMLAQPEEDRWTGEHLSALSLQGLKADFTVRILKGAGHYPHESPGSRDLLRFTDEFISRHL